MGLLDKILGKGSKKPAKPQARYLEGLGSSRRLNTPQRLAMSPRSDADDVRESWQKTAALAINAMHNNGWISGVTDQMTALMIGDGLRANLKADLSYAGMSEADSKAWSRAVEKRFAAYAANPWEVDARGQKTLHQLAVQGVRTWFAVGEHIFESVEINRPGARTRSKLRHIPPWSLSQETEHDNRLVQGVYLDRNGAPAGYLFKYRSRDIPGGITFTEVRRAARDAAGRRLIMHTFDGGIEATRGITPFAPILRVLRNYDELSNATLTAAMIHAIFAATIESDYPTAEVFDALRSEDELGAMESEDSHLTRFDQFVEEKAGWARGVDIDLSRHGKIAHLMLGEKLKLHSSGHPNDNYEQFAAFLLREIARCAGSLYEDLTGDYRGATYSSLRMGIAKQWPTLTYRRRHFAVPIYQLALENWLEEEIDEGRIALPGGLAAFIENKAAICHAQWQGPPKPQADDQKAQKSLEGYRNMGVISDEIICADLGYDIDDIYEARAHEKQRREELQIHGGVISSGLVEDPDAPEEEPGDEGTTSRNPGAQ